jgi:NAD(P)-dependent dehydrogenase (short-subunit alcohol dehydrogenase family)
MEAEAIVITGSTRGLGLCLAREFLRRGCAVMVSGRTAGSVQHAVSLLSSELPQADVRGVPCDAASAEQVQALWTAAEKAFGKVDHWINNAGIGQPTRPIWDLPPEVMEQVVRTNVLGALYGARAAVRGMLPRKRGAVWLMEGHGSDGRIMRGLSAYGATKRALRYVARALAVEAGGTGILIGALSPGIMITDFTMKQLDRGDRESWERTRKVFNILADRPETVARFLVPRILAARRNGSLIAWLTKPKILFRFMTAGITKRTVIDEE